MNIVRSLGATENLKRFGSARKGPTECGRSVRSAKLPRCPNHLGFFVDGAQCERLERSAGNDPVRCSRHSPPGLNDTGGHRKMKLVSATFWNRNRACKESRDLTASGYFGKFATENILCGKESVRLAPLYGSSVSKTQGSHVDGGFVPRFHHYRKQPSAQRCAE